MILRRLAEAFRRQDWFTVAVETMIVVLGVFLGLQVNNWNEARAERDRAHGYLERVRADLRADISQYRQSLAFWKAVSDYGERALDYAETGDAKGATQWDLVLAFFQASQINDVILTETTYAEMKSGGDLGLIESIDLRSLLSRYYALGVNQTLTERPPYRMHLRERIPLKIQAYIWASCYVANAGDAQELRPCAPPIGDDEAAAIVDTLRADEALIDKLTYWMSTQRIAALIADDRIMRAEKLVTIIDGELARMNGARTSRPQ